MRTSFSLSLSLSLYISLYSSLDVDGVNLVSSVTVCKHVLSDSQLVGRVFALLLQSGLSCNLAQLVGSPFLK